ncbi:MAG: helix-turn-helix transcriptional regulator [Sporomusaceae bacterium]|nr:helix-turn-helix transcriptional regulator [Sporomusaceae bacterium]
MMDDDLGKYIVTLRLQSDVSQLTLCQRIGKSRGWLTRRENGRASLSASDLYIIAQALKAPVDAFATDLS